MKFAVALVMISATTAHARMYRAVELGSIAGEALQVYDMGADGSIGYGDVLTTAGIYANGQFRSLAQISGYGFTTGFRLKDANHFYMNRVAAYWQYGDEGVWENGISPRPECVAMGMSAASGDRAYASSWDTSQGPAGSLAVVRRSGIQSVINCLAFNENVNTPVDMNEAGWILGGSGGDYYGDYHVKSWLLAPNSLTPTLLQSNLISNVKRIMDDGNVYGLAQDTSDGRYNFLTGKVEVFKDPAGKGVTNEVFDANNLGQVSINVLRKATASMPAHRSLMLWDNGMSSYVEDMLVNPQVIPLGASMRGAGIDDQGRMAAIMKKGDGVSYLYRFDPVPEPRTWLALGFGVAVLSRRRVPRTGSSLPNL